jgi:protein-disulfide isomerase
VEVIFVDDKSINDVDVGGDQEDAVIHIKRSHFIAFFYAVLIPFALGSGVALGYLIWGRDAPTGTASGSAPMAPAPATQAPSVPNDPEDMRVDVGVDDDPAIGPEDAPITIVEFSDFACSFCRRFHLETFETLLATYPDQIRFVYRDFPVVGGGQTGFFAAQAANCARDQEKYWEYHDVLFQGEYGHGRDAYVSIADDLGLDVDTFETCLDEETYAEEVAGDLQAGRNLGVSGTPTFFINGIPFVGAQPLANFTQVIDAELEQQ